MEKVIEARFRVSILLTQGRQEDIEDLVVVIQSPENRLHVVDFSPKTELATDVTGPIETTKTDDNTVTAEAKLGAGVVARYGVADVGASTSNHQTTKSSFKQLPAKCLVLASGTTHGEHGVFFKVKGSPQVSLEGAKEFTCLFAVPKNWRGDWCTLSCQARAYKKHYLNSKIENCGQSEVFIGMYLVGDDASKAAARRLDAVQGKTTVSMRPSRWPCRDEPHACNSCLRSGGGLQAAHLVRRFGRRQKPSAGPGRHGRLAASSRPLRRDGKLHALVSSVHGVC